MDSLESELSGRNTKLDGELSGTGGMLEVTPSGAGSVRNMDVNLSGKRHRLGGELHASRRTLEVSLSGVSSAATALQNKTVTPAEAKQIVKADHGYAGLGTVTVNAIPEYYGRISYDGAVLTVS